jgi:hypothetical protein
MANSKIALAQEVFVVLDETVQHRLTRRNGIESVEIKRISGLLTEVKIRESNGAPRYFNVQVKELM